ncbi:MAG: hypothetical protein M3Q56_06420 [Bacteroidota bacterium]|nr:hypothetical protein [Bacteroidota bacterium]
MQLTSQSLRIYGSAMLLYALTRITLFIIFGGVQVKSYLILLVIYCVLSSIGSALFLIIYHIIKKSFKPIIAIVLIFIVAHLIAYFTMEDFGKFINAFSSIKATHGEKILKSLKDMSFEGFNYVSSMIALIYLVCKDFGKHERKWN